MLGATTSFPGPLNSHNTATLAAVRRHLAQLNFAGAATFDALGVPLLGGEFQLCKEPVVLCPARGRTDAAQGQPS